MTFQKEISKSVSVYQSGHKKRHSTETVLIYVNISISEKQLTVSPPPAVSIKHLMPGHERETVNFVSFSDLLYGWKF